jgi:hypothetical protein
MFAPIIFTQALDQSASTPHSRLTCGQSRGGGLIPSRRKLRSRFLGRVAVTHVQGSPKGGGALCLRRGINTRLRPSLQMTGGTGVIIRSEAVDAYRRRNCPTNAPKSHSSDPHAQGAVTWQA